MDSINAMAIPGRPPLARWVSLMMPLMFLALAFVLVNLWPQVFHVQDWPHKLRLLGLLVVASLLIGVWHGDWLTIIVTGVSLPLTMAIVLGICALGGSPPSPTTSVGFCSYFGYPTSLELVEIGVLAVVPTLVALCCYWIKKRRTQDAPAHVMTESSIPRWQRILENSLAAAIITALFCFYMPSLADIRSSFNSTVTLGWDYQNAFVWTQLIQTGAKPFRDFWYPYAAQAMFHLPFPYGELLMALHV